MRIVEFLNHSGNARGQGQNRLMMRMMTMRRRMRRRNMKMRSRHILSRMLRGSRGMGAAVGQVSWF